MGFRTGAFATVWSIEQGFGNFKKVRLSVSRKNKDTGEYEQDFSGFCTFIGTADAACSRLKERDRIVLGDVDVSTRFDAEKNKEYINYKVFSFKMADEVYPNAVARQNQPVADNPQEGDIDEDMPF